MAIKLIVGLGNYGQKYQNTRHNIGIWYINLLAIHYKLNFKRILSYGLIGKLTFCNKLVYIFNPETYMNISGEIVKKISLLYQFLTEEILIVHDDLDLFPGNIRIKLGGGHAGHNGVKSIIECLKTKKFYRLRIGIGRPKYKNEINNFVLSEPSFDEKQIIYNVLNKIKYYTDDLINLNFIQMFNKLNLYHNMNLWG